MGLKEIMSDGLISFELHSDNKHDAIQELATLLEKEGTLKNKKKYIKAVIKREKESTTGIGMGIAIPHGKSSAVLEPSLAFGRSKKGINYDSLDGEPVHLMFLVAVPEHSNDEHLKILSQLSRKLMHEEVRQQLMDVNTPEKIYSIFEGDE